jgi:hypothetical protein
MKRETAIARYRQVKDWERKASGILRDQILVKYFSGNECCRHNWCLNFEEGTSAHSARTLCAWQDVRASARRNLAL